MKRRKSASAAVDEAHRPLFAAAPFALARSHDRAEQRVGDEHICVDRTTVASYASIATLEFIHGEQRVCHFRAVAIQ